MADPLQPPNLDGLVDRLIEGLADPEKLQRFERAFGNGIAYGSTVAAGVKVQAAPDLLSQARDVGGDLKFKVEKALGWMLALLVSEIIGVELPEGALTQSSGSPEDSPVGNAISAVVLNALRGPDGALEPGDAGARRFIGMLSHIIVHSWAEGSILQKLEGYTTYAGHLESIAKLGEELVSGLGLSRLARIVLRPIAVTTMATPMRWQTNKIYRPELLSPSDAVRQALRGRWPREKALEEMARQGWSDDRIEALFNAQRKFFSVGDVRTFVDRQHWTNEQALQHLLDQGYEKETASDALRLEGLKRIDQLEAQEATAILSAYVNRDLDDGAFRGLLADAVTMPAERALLEELGRVRRAVNVKGLSAAEARRLTLKGILAVPDYRAALRREGYDEYAVLALELELRADLETDRKIDELRAAALADRAAEKAAKDKAAAARKADVEQQRALARRGPISELARAVVRGLIPISRFEEVLAAQYDADTVQIFVDDVELQRQDYLNQQAAADAARQRAAVRSVSVADLDAAVLAGVLTLDDYRTMLGMRGFSVPDVVILTATLAARLADVTAAKKKRAEAELAAKRKSIDLTRFETLVRRGVRTVPQYVELLASLGFDEAARADLVDLLQLKIVDDQAARELRDQAHADSPVKGLTLDDTRRAVVLGLLPIDAFERFLIDAGYTTDAQLVLLDELRLDVADADAARARRNQTEIPTGASGLPLATVRRAARLGIVAPDVYVARLVAAGWSDDDVAIDLELLLAEIADVQAARAARDQAPTPAGDHELTLAQLAGAVKRGFKTLAEFQSRAVVLGLSKDAIDTQLRVLGDELEETKAAKARRDALVKELDAAAVPIAELETATRDGRLTLADFTATLQQKGLAPDDAALLAGLLEADL